VKSEKRNRKGKKEGRQEKREGKIFHMMELRRKKRCGSILKLF
jgi:hypothetical protein